MASLSVQKVVPYSKPHGVPHHSVAAAVHPDRGAAPLRSGCIIMPVAMDGSHTPARPAGQSAPPRLSLIHISEPTRPY